MSSVINSLWTERYRPKTLAEYVWINDEQQRQVEGWVKDQDIPHLVLSGGPGCGKCLGPNEHIRIRIDSNTLTNKQRSILDQYRITK